MSTDLDFVALLTSIQLNLYRYGGPVLMILGTYSCVLSLLVFMQKTLRKNPCSIYLIAYNTSNLLLIYTSFLSTTLASGYSIDPGSSYLILCRCRFYAMLLFDALSPSYLILASVDRVMVTSTNALTRKRSTARLAHRTIGAITLLWLIGHSHILIFANLIPIAPGVTVCYFQLGAHVTAMGYYALVIKVILMPALMIALGLWTVRNVRRVARISPAPATTHTEATTHVGTRAVHTKDRQLIRILLMDTGVYITFNIMTAVVLTYQEFTKSQPKTYAQSVLGGFLLTVSVFSTYVPYCMSCYTNLLISKTFRHQVKTILQCK